MTPPIQQECPVCHRALARSAFRKPYFARGTSPYDTVCRECREMQGDTFDDDSPIAVAEREVERRYGVSAARWRDDRESPLPVLAYALAVAIVNAQRKSWRLDVHPAWTVAEAERLCETRGLTRIDGGAASAPPLDGATLPHTTTTAAPAVAA